MRAVKNWFSVGSSGESAAHRCIGADSLYGSTAVYVSKIKRRKRVICFCLASSLCLGSADVATSSFQRIPSICVRSSSIHGACFCSSAQRSLGLRDELSVASNYTPLQPTHSLQTCFESTTSPVDVDGLYKAPRTTRQHGVTSAASSSSRLPPAQPRVLSSQVSRRRERKSHLAR